MPVFQRAPMRRSPLVFSESDVLSYSPAPKFPNNTLKPFLDIRTYSLQGSTLKPFLSTPLLSDTKRSFSGNLHSGEWFATW